MTTNTSILIKTYFVNQPPVQLEMDPPTAVLHRCSFVLLHSLHLPMYTILFYTDRRNFRHDWHCLVLQKPSL